MNISVIVPVRNEEKSIAALLEALLSQTLSPTEIAITDGGSTDNTTAIIQTYIDKGAPIRLIRTTKALPGRGRNLAVEHSTSEWLAFTDAGIEPNQEWLASLSEKASDGEVDVVYGSYEPKTDTFFKECAAIAYITPPVEIDGVLMRHHSIASTLMRRSVWETVGGFPEHLRSAEDLVFMNGIEASRFRVAYAPHAVVRWELQPNLTGTLRRFTIYSRNNIRAGLWKDWQASVFKRYLFFLLLMPLAFLIGWWWLVVPLGMWLFFLAARAVVSLYRNRRRYPGSAGRNIRRFVLLLPLIASIDLGAIVGTIQWFLSDKLMRRSSRQT